jgi:muramoyltetrapeptide carboxypeptidase
MWLVPQALTRGSVVRVVAPAGVAAPTLTWRALGFLAERYRLRYDRGIFAASGYLAGDDERRRRELGAALAEPEVAAVVCVRGGYGTLRLVADIDWSLLRRHPRWLVGFSDFTALHVEAARQRVASLHAANAIALGLGDALLRDDFITALETPRAARAHEGLTTWVEGEARGRLCGGNLTVLAACAAAGRLLVPDGAVLFIEDVGEQAFRLDRVLTSLIVGGHLARLAAVVVGELCDCRGANPSAAEVVAERLVGLGIPVVSGLPVGHGRHNAPLTFGAVAHVEARAGAGRVVVALEDDGPEEG